jgi:pimeloyl-ACP methyl ester carboxylesterase
VIVLLHGAGLCGAVWKPLRAHVDAGAPSLPGRDGVPGPAPATVEEAAAWLASTLEAPAVVAGHSYGGAVALELALTRPDLVAGVVLMATGARLRVHPVILETLDQCVQRGEAFDFVRMSLRADADPAVREALDDAIRRTPVTTARADWRACDAFDRVGRLGGLRVPTLILDGDADALTPARYGDYLAREIPGARRVTLRGATHLFPFERAEDVAALLADFSGQVEHQ